MYALGKDTPYGSIAPLVTAICQDVLDTAEAIGYARPGGRLTPAFLACMDEARSIAPTPSLRQRVADGRGRGIAVVHATQSWASIIARQPALYEDKLGWRQVEAEVAAGRAENAAARARLGAPPAGMAL